MREKGSKYRRIVPAPRNRGSKLAPERIRPAEKQLKTILDAATHGYWRWNVTSGEAWLSDGWLASMGYSAVNLPENGTFLAGIVHPDDRGKWDSALEEHLAGSSEALDCECRLRAKAGDYTWFRIRGKIARIDKQGRPVSVVGTFLDIHAQKLAQLELENSHALLSDIFTASEDSVWIVEPENFELIAFNQAIDDLVFRGRGIRLRPGMRLEEIDPERAESWRRFYTSVLEHGKFEKDYHFLPSGDTVHFVSQRLKRDGKVYGISVHGHDVSERNQIEVALRKSEEKFAKAFHQSPLAFTLTRMNDDRLVEVNAGFEQATGHSRDDVIGKTTSDLALWVSTDQRDKLFEELKTTGQFPGAEVAFRTKSGELREALVSGVLIEIDGEPCMFSAGVDITERKRAVEALRDSEERLRIAIDAGRTYAFEWDFATRIVRRSVKGAKILGIKNDASPTKSEFMECVHPEEKQLYENTFQSLSPENSTYKVIFRYIRPDQKTIWLEESGRAFFHPDGKLLKIVGMASDVTEARQSERVLRELSGRLISSQEDERRRVARELHDHIGQELAILCVQAQRVDSGVSDEEHTTHSDVHELYRRIKEIAVDVSKLSHRLHSSELDFLGLSAAAERLCRDFANQYGIDLDYQIKKVPPRLDSAKSLCFYRILQESLQNVAKHSRATRVVVELHANAKELILRVDDNGIGFDLESVRFASGLGLVSMRERLKLIGGRLEINSEVGHGTHLVAAVVIPSDPV
jgi:PAS domain S-box-containing protein